MSETLKACPFCGGEAYFLTPEKCRGSAFVTVGVECKKCGAVPYITQVYEDSTEQHKREAAMAPWNRRTGGE